MFCLPRYLSFRIYFCTYVLVIQTDGALLVTLATNNDIHDFFLKWVVLLNHVQPVTYYLQLHEGVIQTPLCETYLGDSPFKLTKSLLQIPPPPDTH